MPVAGNLDNHAIFCVDRVAGFDTVFADGDIAHMLDLDIALAAV